MHPTSASCLPQITGLTQLALGHQLKYPFHSQILGKQEGAPSVNSQLRASPQQTLSYAHLPLVLQKKSLGEGALVRIIEIFG